MELNGSQFANLSGVTRQAIHKACSQDATLVKNENGKFSLADELNYNYLFSHGITKNEMSFFMQEGLTAREIKNEIARIKGDILVFQKTEKIKEPVVSEKKTTQKNKKVVKIEKEKITEKVVSQKKIESKMQKTDNDNVNFDDDFENVSGLPEEMMNLNLKQLVRKYGGPMMLKNWVDILNKLMQANERDQKIQEKKLDLIDKDFVTSRLFSYVEVLHNQIFNVPLSISDHIIAMCASDNSNIRIEIVEYLKSEIETLIKDAKKNINNELDNLKHKFDKSDDIDV